MDSESFDTIIVGAGPAGLKCAEILSKANKKVLVLEKNKVIGKKVCAGGLTLKTVSQFKVPKNIIGKEYHEIRVHSSLMERLIPLEKHLLCTVDRQKLAEWQIDSSQIRKLIRTDSQVTQITENHVLVDDKKISYRYLVGSDGSNSIVRQYLGLKTEKVCLAMQYLIPSTEFNKVEFFFNSRYFHSWYAWIFPQKDFVSIGCAADNRFVSGNRLNKNFHAWLKKRGIDVSQGKFEAANINYDYRGYHFGNIFLAGDAAGLASGLTGEGIYQAMVSGEEIAKIILGEKNSNRIDLIAEEMRMHRKILRLLQIAGPFRMLVYELIALLSGLKSVRRKILDFWALSKSQNL